MARGEQSPELLDIFCTQRLDGVPYPLVFCDNVRTASVDGLREFFTVQGQRLRR